MRRAPSSARAFGAIHLLPLTGEKGLACRPFAALTAAAWTTNHPSAARAARSHALRQLQPLHHLRAVHAAIFVRVELREQRAHAGVELGFGDIAVRGGVEREASGVASVVPRTAVDQFANSIGEMPPLPSASARANEDVMPASNSCPDTTRSPFESMPVSSSAPGRTIMLGTSAPRMPPVGGRFGPLAHAETLAMASKDAPRPKVRSQRARLTDFPKDIRIVPSRPSRASP